jgi:hypothetical protein
MRQLWILALATCCAALSADLESVRAQPNLEKRSELALVYADSALAEAKTAWRQGEMKEFSVKLDDVRDAVVLSLDSLQKTGRPPNKSFAEEVSLDDRPAVQKVNERVQAVHEEFLLGVLSRKK